MTGSMCQKEILTTIQLVNLKTKEENRGTSQDRAAEREAGANQHLHIHLHWGEVNSKKNVYINQ